jgi:hypothetical protein
MFGRRFSARSEGNDVRRSGELCDYTQAVSHRTQHVLIKRELKSRLTRDGRILEHGRA